MPIRYSIVESNESTLLSQIDLDLEGQWFSPLIDQVRRELRSRKILFFPHLWLSDEWFCPEGYTGVAIPFYLCDRKFIALEKKNVGKVEGGTNSEFLKIFRHEVAHALEHAYDLQNHPLRVKTFGSTHKNYPKSYVPMKYSKKYVLHLPDNYAQSHPDEDFAETFAVWLQPKSQWLKKYKGWPALNKLLIMDQLMGEIKGQPPIRRKDREMDRLSSLNVSLKQYYSKRRSQLRTQKKSKFDIELLSIFSKNKGPNPAYDFLLTEKKSLIKILSQALGQPQYTFEPLYGEILNRTKKLKLYVSRQKIKNKKEMLDFFTEK